MHTTTINTTIYYTNILPIKFQIYRETDRAFYSLCLSNSYTYNLLRTTKNYRVLSSTLIYKLVTISNTGILVEQPDILCQSLLSLSFFFLSSLASSCSFSSLDWGHFSKDSGGTQLFFEDLVSHTFCLLNKRRLLDLNASKLSTLKDY